MLNNMWKEKNVYVEKINEKRHDNFWLNNTAKNHLTANNKLN